MYYSVKEFAQKLGVSEVTLRLWDKNGKLKPHHKTTGGHRVYSDSQIQEYFNQSEIKEIKFTFKNNELSDVIGLDNLSDTELQQIKNILIRTTVR